MQRVRHSQEEIAAKLVRADEMAARGKLHGDIARELGVSLMTYHRWRKARPVVRREEQVPATPHSESPPTHEQMERLKALELENTRLRRLVTDLLLEKMRIEEEANAPSPANRGD